MFDQVSASEAAKWALLVFAAGFIGFFGKSLGRAILSIFQKKKEKGSPASRPSGVGLPLSGPLQPGSGKEIESGPDSPKENDQKVMKKALKAQEKAMKKQGKK